MIMRQIRLSMIDIEKKWLEENTSSDEDQTRSAYTKHHKIDPILALEGPTAEDRYVLISSYTAYEKLHQANHKLVWGIVHSPTSPLQRMLKRLYLELHLHKKTGYDAGHMVFDLWERGYTIRQISQWAKVTPQIVHSVFLRTLKQKQEESRPTPEEWIYYYGMTDGMMYVPEWQSWPRKNRNTSTRSR